MAPSGLLEGRRLGVQIVAKMRRGLAFESQDAPRELGARATEVVQEKPHTLNSMAVPIALAVTIPVIIIIVGLIFLHRRNVKRFRAEDDHDPNRDLDFGLNDTPMEGKKPKKQRKSLLFGSEKATQHKINQLSMDMNLSSPYLLPPQAQGSRETLSRNVQDQFDPYRPVAEYISETGSIRSKEVSVYEPSRHASFATNNSSATSKLPPLRQMSFPKPPSAPSEKSDPFATPTTTELPALPATAKLEEANLPIRPVVPEIGTVPYPDEKSAADLPAPPIIPRRASDRVASPVTTHGRFELPESNDIGAAHAGNGEHMPSPRNDGEPAGLGLNFDLPSPPIVAGRYSDGPDLDKHGQAPTIQIADDRRSKDSYYPDQPETQTSEYYEDYQDYTRGRPLSRQPATGYDEQPQQGLGVPQQQSKRMSIGLRPLPPQEINDSEDPEYRANRIRSFYKEYFDDSKEAPPVPQANEGGYYEDYDQQYLGDIAYFDSDSNAFVMPYAQPVTRRAMTPPPAGRRGGGPRGPGPRPSRGPRGPGGPHGPHGSVGGMSLPGGPRSRSGSSWGPRPGSSASAAYGRQPPKKKLPPPAVLNTLPAPSKLRDDSFALMNATDFAPPEAFSERARGRSQSPLGERRPYSPRVPAASPLVTSFDDMAVLPSPHLLRKSSTFTGLDFAPPKKFKDPDAMSDAGSIRSNRSGMSASAMSAVRSGAGRVSRLPGDTVFTQAAMANQLKPAWDMNR
jgi:hypothetical protein